LKPRNKGVCTIKIVAAEGEQSLLGTPYMKKEE
jgi:hypothetical protein